jgi:hypothetical protein
VTERYFVALLLALPFTLAAGLWMYAFTQCTRLGRIVLTAGLYLVFEPRIGRHEMPVYEDEPVHIRERRTEDERAAEYAAMKAETELLPLTVSAAPYTAWTSALHPTELDELRASLDAVVRTFQRDLTARLDAVVDDFLREHTEEHLLVGV